MSNDFAFPSLDFDVPELSERKPRAKKQKPIYTCDLETDPFKYGRFPHPFAAGFYDGKNFQSTWGANCVDEIVQVILATPPGIVYFHNGGKFDIFYFLQYILGNPAFIINRRIVRAMLEKHEIRDSYAIMPFPLKDFDKDEIDYKLFERDVREKHKTEILKYLKKDCTSLWQLCTEFNARFGSSLTIGSTSMRELKKDHKFENLGPITDKEIRSLYYYGGRVEYFKRGILPGRWKVYDVNSMYPTAMRNFLHPLDMPEAETVKLRSTTCFISALGKNYGAFPQRTKDGLRFDIEDGLFHVSRHEWDAALSHNLFAPRRIVRCVNFRDRGNFATFVDHYYNLRKQAKDSGDVFGTIFYKYILNSAYGKFAQNPEDYFEHVLDGPGSDWRDRGFEAALVPDVQDGFNREWDFILWRKKSADFSRYNVATGASITGAARAILMEAIAKADTPIYCDTDSIICKNLKGVEFDQSKLGAWKLEATADTAMIAGRKLYALTKKKELVKMASKGVKISVSEIERVCKGEVVQYQRDNPTFGLDGSVRYITRRIRMT